jgi:hypothetical protein
MLKDAIFNLSPSIIVIFGEVADLVYVNNARF